MIVIEHGIETRLGSLSFGSSFISRTTLQISIMATTTWSSTLLFLLKMAFICLVICSGESKKGMLTWSDLKISIIFFNLPFSLLFVLLGKGTRDIFTSGCKGGGKGFSTNYSSWISFSSWTSIDVLASNRGTFSLDFGSSNTLPLLKNMALHCSLGPSHLGCSSWLGRAPFGLSLPSLFNCHITCCINYYCWCYWLCINCFIVWCIELNN